MKSTSTMPITGEVLRVPRRLAEALIIDGLTPAQLRLAIVLVCLAAEDGSWTIAKPILEAMSNVEMDNAFKVLGSLEDATLILPATDKSAEQKSKLFELLDYKPGLRRKTAGMISVRIADTARLMLQSMGGVVTIPAAEFRLYGSLGGIVMRLRVGARMSKVKTSKTDVWRLDADSVAEAFGPIGSKWSISRQTKEGDQSYVSLARASQLFFEPGIDEINALTETMNIRLRALTLGDGPRARWKAIIIETHAMQAVRRKGDPAPVEKPRTMADLNNVRESKLPAYARKKRQSIEI